MAMGPGSVPGRRPVFLPQPRARAFANDINLRSGQVGSHLILTIRTIPQILSPDILRKTALRLNLRVGGLGFKQQKHEPGTGVSRR